MTVHILPPEHGKRRRRAHQKSRRGCGNCKLRRVKCDETQPKCKQCISYGVGCSYDVTTDALQLAMKGIIVFGAPQGSPVSVNETILNLLNTPPSTHSSSLKSTSSTYELRDDDLEIANRFLFRTVLTVGTRETVHVFQEEWFRIACQDTMLMHIMLAMTLMHDRYLSGFADRPESVKEAYHHYEGTRIFHRKISLPINPSDRDALWAAAALLGALSFADVPAKTYEEAWPLKANSDLDLNWLRMSEGKKAVWKLADPTRPESVIRKAWPLLRIELLKQPSAGLKDCPTFIDLYGLNEQKVCEEDPYHHAVSLLLPLLDIECDHSSIVHFLCFVGHTQPEYRRLLAEKDALALLLLAYWYAKVCIYKQWWIQPRALLECQAICIYLERYHSHEKGIQALLQFPRSMCGLESP